MSFIIVILSIPWSTAQSMGNNDDDDDVDEAEEEDGCRLGLVGVGLVGVVLPG